MLARSGERIPPCGVPVFVPLTAPSSERMPETRNAFTSAKTRLSPTRSRTRSIRAGCEISSKHEVMSPSKIHSYERALKWRISSIASWARRIGRNP